MVLLITFIPTTQAKPLRSTMEVYFQPDFTIGGNPIWVGDIHGDLEGTMSFVATGPIPPKDVGFNDDNFIGPWNVHFFTEDWEIVTPDGKICGIDEGCTVAANWKFRMNGVVTYADGIYSNLVGHRVHMHGQIDWSQLLATGVVNIN